MTPAAMFSTKAWITFRPKARFRHKEQLTAGPRYAPRGGKVFVSTTHQSDRSAPPSVHYVSTSMLS
jgi:hypothetical protein